MSQTIFVYRIVTFCDEPFQDSSTNGLIFYSPPLKGEGPTTPPVLLPKVWAIARSLATTNAISSLMSVPLGTKMFQFPRLLPCDYVFIAR